MTVHVRQRRISLIEHDRNYDNHKTHWINMTENSIIKQLSVLAVLENCVLVVKNGDER